MPTGSNMRCPTVRPLTSGPSASMSPTPSLPPIAGSGGNMPDWPVSVSTSEGLIGAASTLISTWPGASAGVENATASITSCGTGPRWLYWARFMAWGSLA